MCGAMTWISDPKLVSLMSNLGAFGVLAAGNMPPELFSEYVAETRKLTDRPFGGNVITIAPNYQAHLDILCQEKVGHIVFAGSLPRGSEVAQAKESGAKVLCFASTSSIAKRMLSYGADGLMRPGEEFGNGHGSAAHIWTALNKFYEQSQVMIPGISPPMINYHDSWVRLWDLHTKDEELREGRVMHIPPTDRLPLLPWEHNCLVLSYDNAIVAGRENLELLASSLDLFYEKHHENGRIDHTEAMAKAKEELLQITRDDRAGAIAVRELTDQKNKLATEPEHTAGLKEQREIVAKDIAEIDEAIGKARDDARISASIPSP